MPQPAKNTANLLFAGQATQPATDGVLYNFAAMHLKTIIRLRWLALAGQLITVLLVNLWLAFPLPLAGALLVISLSTWLNIFLIIRARKITHLELPAITALIGFDIIELAALLALTGGLNNPFAFFMIIPATIAASILPLRHVVGLSLLTITLSTSVMFYHLPLPWLNGDEPHFPLLFIAGIWVSLTCAVTFSCFYAYRIAREARDMSTALNATEMVLAREQRLNALDGLAAAAAHELGSPLSTIYLIAKELKRDAHDADSFAEDVELLQSQASRCRDILAKLASRDSQSDSMYRAVRISEILDDLITPLRDSGINFTVITHDSDTNEPVLERSPGMIYSLKNLLENASDFAATTAIVTVHWDQNHLNLTIEDDGPGFTPAILERLGNPYVTSRPGFNAETKKYHETTNKIGMGLGIFIAKTLLERSGANMRFANHAPPDHGAKIIIDWPLSAVKMQGKLAF